MRSLKGQLDIQSIIRLSELKRRSEVKRKRTAAAFCSMESYFARNGNEDAVFRFGVYTDGRTATKRKIGENGKQERYCFERRTLGTP